MPHYMVWWRIDGLSRIDEWEAYFRTPEGRLYQAETPVTHAVRFLQNGVFDEVIGGDASPLPPGLHLVEYFSSSTIEATTSGNAMRPAPTQQRRASFDTF